MLPLSHNLEWLRENPETWCFIWEVPLDVFFIFIFINSSLSPLSAPLLTKKTKQNFQYDFHHHHHTVKQIMYMSEPILTEWKYLLLTSDSGRLYWQMISLLLVTTLFMTLVDIRTRAARRSARASCTRRCTYTQPPQKVKTSSAADCATYRQDHAVLQHLGRAVMKQTYQISAI